MTAAARPVLRIAGRLAILVAAILLLNFVIGGFFRSLEYEIRPETEDALRRGLLMTCLIYGLLLATPFVPGVEIGIGLLSMFGATAALQVYIATISGLSLAFLVGRLVPLRLIAGAALKLRMTRLAGHLTRLEGLPHAERLAHLSARAPGGWGPFLLRNRYLALALLLNIPGNALIGGGGGIALAAGLSRLYSPPVFLVVVALAVAPVPLIVALFGPETLF